MKSQQSSIVFLDNSLNRIYKTITGLKNTFSKLSIFNTEEEMFEFLDENAPDVILLNLDLSPNDGMVLLKEIRHRYPMLNSFIIIYSDKQDDFIQELAYNSGVDAFIHFHNKPSLMTLFLANLLRRRTGIARTRQNELVIDNERYLVYKNGVPFQLPRKEFRLLELLYNNSGKFFSKIEIADSIWKDARVAGKRTIDVHIYNIRQFFGKKIIQSQKGKGYRINKKITG